MGPAAWSGHVRGHRVPLSSSVNSRSRFWGVLQHRAFKIGSLIIIAKERNWVATSLNYFILLLMCVLKKSSAGVGEDQRSVLCLHEAVSAIQDPCRPWKCCQCNMLSVHLENMLSNIFLSGSYQPYWLQSWLTTWPGSLRSCQTASRLYESSWKSILPRAWTCWPKLTPTTRCGHSSVRGKRLNHVTARCKWVRAGWFLWILASFPPACSNFLVSHSKQKRVFQAQVFTVFFYTCCSIFLQYQL